jgi:hypothetical protein
MEKSSKKQVLPIKKSYLSMKLGFFVMGKKESYSFLVLR